MRTFHEWSREVRRRHFPQLPERVREDTPALVARLKLHPAMETALERQVARTPGEPSRARAIDDWLSALGDLSLLESVFAETAPDAFRSGHLEEAVDALSPPARGRAGASGGRPRRPGRARSRGRRAVVTGVAAAATARCSHPTAAPLVLRHVAIDEVQDFSPLEVRVLLECADERRSVTLAGDTQQHVMQAAGFTRLV